jgi:CrcB protein
MAEQTATGGEHDDHVDRPTVPEPIDPDLLPSAPTRRAQAPVLASIALGGVAGTLARYAAGRIGHVAPDSFPWPTFTVNVTGSFALGLLLTLIVERWPPSRYARPFLAIGFLGAYTTFSTFMVETDVLVKDGAVGVAALYLGASLLVGFVAVYGGIVAGRLVPRARGRA